MDRLSKSSPIDLPEIYISPRVQKQFKKEKQGHVKSIIVFNLIDLSLYNSNISNGQKCKCPQTVYDNHPLDDVRQLGNKASVRYRHSVQKGKLSTSIINSYPTTKKYSIVHKLRRSGLIIGGPRIMSFPSWFGQRTWKTTMGHSPSPTIQGMWHIMQRWRKF